ncbi:endonuclease NucS domain-containing protein [Klebsiella pneumoniae]|uniref:endonuclease NucS domain-containing protein n=1 Tax=Klebsiella TaxID=570 RepID=UPI001072B75D|nr:MULTISPECIES: endonuclease NucS domain-containing protein [Klebsiella]MBE3270819.1 DUF91 domain-containing protein [Klebsiella pneumoniae]MBU0219767.1 DUF91 domain-containing protein [Klebsiella pneumoniae]MCS4385954.1 endonuclease NucS [Klebsiella quasipneumoniae subsp. similipneumoniae]MCS4414859.1 endonuclease NucS [Klebsiella quasipneumoniae subsp. similipneumoniae]MCS5806238.1 endonuclease NucS [Klebsiella pneumoniae subsp. pneumoniae]
MKENELRDLVCERMDVFGEDLILLDKEKYIPNKLGTKSFIDIYAKDKQNNHVLIELKRSNQAARQALHEVMKYAEGVKSYFGANDDEIRIIIASTEWSELLVPFSSLVHSIQFPLKGVDIKLDGRDISVETIQPLKYNKGRFISPAYDVFWYKDEINLNEGGASIIKTLTNAGIYDFLITILKADKPIPSSSKERRIGVIKDIMRMNKLEAIDSDAELFSYIVFLSVQAMSASEHLDIIKKTKPNEVVEEVKETIEELEEEEQIEYLRNYSFDLENIESDYYEIGNPAKFMLYFNTHGIKLHKLIRKGFFELNENLTNDIILAELKGTKGNSAQNLQANISINCKQKLSNLKEAVQDLLDANLAWQSQILQILAEIQQKYPDSTIELNIYHPRLGLFSLYYTFKEFENKESYLPCYSIYVKNTSTKVVKIYFGCLQGNTKSLSFYEVIDKYYSGNIQELMLTMIWGGREYRDDEILDDLGMSYMSFCWDIETGKKFTLINNKWREDDVKSVYGYFYEYIERNEGLMFDILNEISFYDQGDKFCTPIIDTHIIIERKQIENLDTSKLHDFFKYLTSSRSAMKYFQGKIDISINGYDADGELYNIVDVRKYLIKVSEEIRFLFFFINPNGFSQILRHFFLAYAEVKSETITSEGNIKIELDTSNVGSFFEHQFSGLNELTDFCGMSIDENKAITDAVMSCINVFYS